MHLPHTAEGWTAERVENELRDEEHHWPRYELVDGELLVTPGANLQHQAVVVALVMKLGAYLAAHPIGRVFTALADVRLDDLTTVQPDVFVVPRVAGAVPRTWRDLPEPRLILAVEVLSPSTARSDRFVKRRRFQRAGAEFWIVDPDARLVERWLPADDRPEIAAEQLVWSPRPDAPPLVIDVPALLAEALDA